MSIRVKQAKVFSVMLLATGTAQAAIDNAGVLDNALQRYANAAAGWANVIQAHATWLFWTLVLISMVWTFGFMLLRRAELNELFAELIRFSIFTGFFWWLLINGPAIANAIIASLRQIGGNATGLGQALAPSGIVDIGFSIFERIIDESSVWSPVDSAVGIIIGVVILVIIALIGINMLLLLISAWILAYGGIFFLGFGGSRWTSGIAINYYRTVLGIAAQLLTMVLLIGIGEVFLNDYFTQMSGGVVFKEMGVLLIVAIILLMLVNKVPQLIAGIITGASVGGMGIGSFGAGAAVGAAGMAAAAATMGGAMLAAGTAQAAGGAAAIMQAISAANRNVTEGTDFLSRLGGATGAIGPVSSKNDTANTAINANMSPLTEAAGFSGQTMSSITGGMTTANTETTQAAASRHMVGASTANATAPTSTASHEAVSEAATPPPTNTDRPAGFMATAGRVAADASIILARSASDVAKANVTTRARARIDNTLGGKIAADIRKRTTPTFGGNRLSGTDTRVDKDAEIASFRDKQTPEST